MIKVAICDDDKDIRMKIHLVVKNYFSEIKLQITLKRNASSATAELLFHF